MITAAEGPALGRIRSTRIYLAAAHLDHDPDQYRFGNVKAFCQCCRMLRDRAEQHHRRWLTLRVRRVSQDLFLGA